MPNTSRLQKLLNENESELLAEWLQAQQASTGVKGRISDTELKQQSADFLRLFAETLVAGDLEVWTDSAWDNVKGFLETICRTRAAQGYSPAEVASFIFSLKQPVFVQLQRVHRGQEAALAEDLWTLTLVVDRLGLYTTEIYQKAREEVIARQQAEMLELSTPVVKLWDGILALPLIGTLDSARTQVVMETLLQNIVQSGSTIAIIDITGVPTVDTLVAQHLLKTVTAARLMGADCIISGIRPQIAQTIVHLGVELGDVITKANLADAFRLALRRSGVELVAKQSASSGEGF